MLNAEIVLIANYSTLIVVFGSKFFLGGVKASPSTACCCQQDKNSATYDKKCFFDIESNNDYLCDREKEVVV